MPNVDISKMDRVPYRTGNKLDSRAAAALRAFLEARKSNDADIPKFEHYAMLSPENLKRQEIWNPATGEVRGPLSSIDAEYRAENYFKSPGATKLNTFSGILPEKNVKSLHSRRDLNDHPIGSIGDIELPKDSWTEPLDYSVDQLTRPELEDLLGDPANLRNMTEDTYNRIHQMLYGHAVRPLTSPRYKNLFLKP